MTRLFYKVKRESKLAGEFMDCAVIAVAIATGLPYKEVHKEFTKAGRKPRRRTKNTITLAVLESLGYKLKERTIKAKTVITAERELKRGVYLIRVRGHILACKAGEIHDWTKDRRHRIIEVNRVIKQR